MVRDEYHTKSKNELWVKAQRGERTKNMIGMSEKFKNLKYSSN